MLPNNTTTNVPDHVPDLLQQQADTQREVVAEVEFSNQTENRRKRKSKMKTRNNGDINIMPCLRYPSRKKEVPFASLFLGEFYENEKEYKESISQWEAMRDELRKFRTIKTKYLNSIHHIKEETIAKSIPRVANALGIRETEFKKLYAEHGFSNLGK